MQKTLAVGQVDIGNALTDMWRSVLLFVPRAIAFIVILVVGWLIAKAVLKIVDAALERVGFDRAVERGGIRRALERTKYDASDILAKLAYYAVLLFTLQFAFGVWGPNAISDLIRGVVSWLPRAFIAIVIVVVAAAIANAVRDLVTGFLGGLSYGRVLADLTAIFILALGVIAALNQVGIATTVTTPVLIAVLATVAGILIVGVGGGLVRPMQNRWEGWLDRAVEESRALREHRQAQATGRGDVERRMADRGAERARAMPEGSMTGARGGQGTYRSGNMPGDETQQFGRPGS
ncbi:mechanosensitive ion channel family protein [Micromonospora haikouensis]|uniref:mechanosensitive ion channel family protein n=1 Tax=Micromonospora haikouensis TaxID=686309 RepID=UPI003D8FE84D